MSTERENFHNEGAHEAEGVSGDFTQAMHVERGGSYQMPEFYRVGDLEVSVAELRTLALAGLEHDPVVRGLSLEEREELGETYADMAEVAHLAQSDTPPAAKKQAMLDTFANALYASPDDGEVFTEDESNEAEKHSATPSSEHGFTHWVNTKGKSIARAVLVAASISAIPQAAMAGGNRGDFGGIFDRAVVSRVEGGVHVKRSIEGINAKIERIHIDIERLEREKAIHLERTQGQVGVQAVQQETQTDVRLIQLESRYKADKINLEARRTELEARYAAKPNPSAADTARHRADMMRIEAQEVRLDGSYEAERVKIAGGVRANEGRMGNQMIDANARLERIDIEIERRVSELRRLEAEKTNVLIQGGFRIFRR